MPDTLTDEHHDWVTSTLGADPRSFVAPAPAEEEPRSGGFFDSLAATVSSAASAVADTARAAGSAVSDAASDVASAAVSAATTVADAASEAAHVVADGAEAAGSAIADAAESAATAVTDTAKAAGSAVAGAAESAYDTVHDAIVPPPIPQARAKKAMSALSPEDQAKVQAVLDGAKSEKEKDYITKTIAAGHTPAEIEAFAATIAGKDEAWMNDNLRLVGDSKGKGVRQQWSFSCAPTTVEAIKGELDPIYAMKLRQENPDFQEADNADGTAMNPAMAEDQRHMLEDDGGRGKATSRDDPDKEGAGMVFKTLLNKQSGDTGLQFDNKVIGKGYSADDAMADMEKGLEKEVPVPITVGDATSPYAHAALVVATDKGPPRTFTIHDPWYGATQTFTEDQIRNDQVSIGDWKHVGVVFPPSLK